MEMVFSGDSAARNAIAGMYYMIMNTKSLLNGSVSIYAALSADELICVSSADEQFYKNELVAENSAVYTYLWKPGYNEVNIANSCITGLENSSGISADVKRKYLGEARFIRGLCYWYLTNLFGDVPLTTAANVKDNISLSRASAASVFQQIQDDLRQAMSLLPAQDHNNFPGKYAACALLARASCYLNEWHNAEKYATAVITEGGYNLSNDLNKVFTAGSSEVIFQLPSPTQEYSTFEGFSFIPATSSANLKYALSNTLLHAFEANDQRKSTWVKSVLINGQLYYYPYKYKIKNSSQAAECNVILRLAELYLIRAEARARSGNIPGAVDDINIIRNRAGLDPLPRNITFNECLDAIEQERRLEFFAEWGHRWFDLKRTHKINAVLTAAKGTSWQSTDTLYPIPAGEIIKNPMLIQNEGYK
jgi:hypothetical protein